MRKPHILFVLIISLILLSTLTIAANTLTREERLLVNQCRQECVQDMRSDVSECRTESKSCYSECKEEYNTCIDNQETILEECKSNCTDKSCVRQCSSDFRANKRQLCDYNSCRKLCSIERRECRREALTDYRECRSSCQYTPFDSNIKCEYEGITYRAGQKFLEGCDSCKCRFDGSVDCQDTQFCNFQDVIIPKRTCESSGGLYLGLCRGPYFGIGCSQKKYCLCAGDDNYSCPLDHTCILDFEPPRIKSSSVPGWKNMIGQPLGDIGVCAENPDLPDCGNGICDNTLQGRSQLAETELNCPADCL
jgi:hypothetical protein